MKLRQYNQTNIGCQQKNLTFRPDIAIDKNMFRTLTITIAYQKEFLIFYLKIANLLLQVISLFFSSVSQVNKASIFFSLTAG